MAASRVVLSAMVDVPHMLTTGRITEALLKVVQKACKRSAAIAQAALM